LDDGDPDYEKFRPYPSSPYRCTTPGLGFYASTPSCQSPFAIGNAISKNPESTSEEDYPDDTFDFGDPDVVQAICEAMDGEVDI
jgi:hypothetical protein